MAEHLEREREYSIALDELKKRTSRGERETAMPILAKLMAVDSEGEALLGTLREFSERLPESRFGQRLMDKEVQVEFDKRLLSMSKVTASRQEALAKIEISLNGYVEEPRLIVCSLVRAKRAPPTAAYFLLDLLLAEADRKAIPGDLVEEFATSILPKYGARGARLWFWTQTVRTIATRNPVCRWLLVGGLVRFGEWIFRAIG
jgi:hypothetical protein